MTNKLLYLLLGIGIGGAFSSCKKNATSPDWEITVKNSSGTVVAYAHVSIAKTETDWRNGNYLSSQYTGSDGKVTFTGLEVAKYFANVESGGMSNWEGGVLVDLTDNKITKTNIEIKNNPSYYLKGSWRIIKIDSAGTNITSQDSCILDDQFSFGKGNRDGVYSYVYGSEKCTSTEPSGSASTWSYNATNKTITVQWINQESYEIKSNLYVDTMVVAPSYRSVLYYLVK